MQVSIDPIPTHIQYWTTWVAKDGSIQFRTDLYQRDLDLEVALTDRDAQGLRSMATPRGQKPLKVSALN
jgi:murein L,D-transpeptidase YcbB/YkuD